MKLSSSDISHHVKTFGVAKTTSTSAISVDESGSSSHGTISVNNDTSTEKESFLNMYTDHEGETSRKEMIASDHEVNNCSNLHLVTADNIPIDQLTDQEDNSSLNLNSEVSLADQNPTLPTSDSSMASPTSNLDTEDLEESVQLSTMDGGDIDSDGLDSEVSLAEVPHHLREILEEDELYSSIKATLPLFEGSSVSVLQALCGYLAWFTEHPGMSKSALSDLLRLHHEQILPPGNSLSSCYDEAYAFIKPFLLPFVVYDACPNDCVLFRKTDRYDYTALTNCPICNGNRFRTARNPARKFYYYPLGPRWKRMFGNATVAEVLQSHDIAQEECVDDIIGSPLWKKVYDDGGFFEGERRGISAQLSTDGVNPFSSNKVIYSMWPIMLTVLNLPKRIRNLFSNMMLVGIIPGNGDHEAKSIDPYLEVVVDELLALSGTAFYDAYSKAPFDFKVHILSYVLDYPGLNKLFHCTGANALQGCMWCDMRGKPNLIGLMNY